MAAKDDKREPVSEHADARKGIFSFVYGVLACLWPARRAARIDPVVALRT